MTDTELIRDELFSPPLEWDECFAGALVGNVFSSLTLSFREDFHQWYGSFGGYSIVFRHMTI